MKEELFPDAQQILDLFHAKENTHKFSKLIFRDEEKAETWAKDTCTRLENGEWQTIEKAFLLEVVQLKAVTKSCYKTD